MGTIPPSPPQFCTRPGTVAGIPFSGAVDGVIPLRESKIPVGRPGASERNGPGAFSNPRGGKILDTNWRVRWGELDIVALRDDQLIVVEVRTTRGTRFGYGYESVDFRKRQQVRRLALRYLQEKGLFHLPVRFDVISVLLGGDNRPKEHSSPGGRLLRDTPGQALQ